MTQPTRDVSRRGVQRPLTLRWRGGAQRRLASPKAPLHDVGESCVVASFDEYLAAEQAVDLLVGRGFPIDQLRISGEDLRLVEDVTGPLTYGLAALRGLVAGVCFGTLLGLLFGALSLTDPLVSAVTLAAWGGLIGGGAGVLVSTLGRWFEEGRRDFLSFTRVEASHYILLCDVDKAEEARRILGPVT